MDKYYTKPETALICSQFLMHYILQKKIKNYVFLEPSAGNGSFLEFLPDDVLAFDLYPEKEGIIKKDFLKEDISEYIPKDKKVIIIGNPPFGYKSKLAIEFLNKSFEYSDIVGFILPKTFQKNSVKNRINLDYECVFEFDLGLTKYQNNCFSVKVPTVFQIWARVKNKRQKQTKKTHSDKIEFTNKEKAKYAIRRVGRDAGKVYTSFDDYSEQSNLFFNCSDDIYLAIKNGFNYLNKIAQQSAGTPSLPKSEIIKFLEKNNN